MSALEAFKQKLAEKKLKTTEAPAKPATRFDVVLPEVPPIKEKPKAEVAKPKAEKPKPAKVKDSKLGENSNREKWLMAARAIMHDYFWEKKKVNLPEFRVSVGFSQGQRGTDKLKGQTKFGHETTDGIAQVFITPVAQDSHHALTLLLIEAARICSGRKAGRRFDQIALALGLVYQGAATSTTCEYYATAPILALFNSIVEKIGAYPHAAIRADAVKKQTVRQLLTKCLVTGYKARTTEKWLTQFGAPICPCCKTVMTAEE